MFGIIIEDQRHYRLFASPWGGLKDDLLGFVGFWLFLMLLTIVASFVACVVYTSIARRNVFKGFMEAFWTLLSGVQELFGAVWGFRRVLAIARLSFVEALRGRVLYVFFLFLAPFLFAGWFITKTPEGQLLYLIGFVHTAITFTLLPMVVFLVSMSLPNDIQNRVVQTIVTKPVRRLEIIFGRILGFTGIFTLVLLVMGLVSVGYLYMYLNKHVSPAEFRRLWAARAPTLANTMPIAADKGLRAQLNVPENAPIPQRYLMFFRKGQWDYTGTNVGREWNYRFHVEGGRSGDKAVFGFQFDPQNLETFDGEGGLKYVKANFEFDIFKTTKGDPTREQGVGEKAEQSGVNAMLNIVPRGGGEAKTFSRIVRADHHRVVELLVPASVVQGGRVEVEVSCLTPNQFLGVADADAYFLSRETNFAVNFFKGLASIWFKMFILICFAVAASTALKGFVTVLFTTTVFTVGMFLEFLAQVATRRVAGGGPFESMIRLASQANQMTPIDEANPLKWVLMRLDKGMLWLMQWISAVIPPLNQLDTVQYVAHGIDVPATLVVRNFVIVCGYVAPALVVGYFLLRNRELAA